MHHRFGRLEAAHTGQFMYNRSNEKIPKIDSIACDDDVDGSYFRKTQTPHRHTHSHKKQNVVDKNFC